MAENKECQDYCMIKRKVDYSFIDLSTPVAYGNPDSFIQLFAYNPNEVECEALRKLLECGTRLFYTCLFHEVEELSPALWVDKVNEAIQSLPPDTLDPDIFLIRREYYDKHAEGLLDYYQALHDRSPGRVLKWLEEYALVRPVATRLNKRAPASSPQLKASGLTDEHLEVFHRADPRHWPTMLLELTCPIIPTLNLLAELNGFKPLVWFEKVGVDSMDLSDYNIEVYDCPEYGVMVITKTTLLVTRYAHQLVQRKVDLLALKQFHGELAPPHLFRDPLRSSLCAYLWGHSAAQQEVRIQVELSARAGEEQGNTPDQLSYQLYEPRLRSWW